MGRKPQPRVQAPPQPVPGAVWVPLTRGQWTLVDESDAPEALAYNWHVTQAGYAGRMQNGKLIRLHVQLMGIKGVDHINRNTLDNRRSNLRPATGTQNQGNRPKNRRNQSGFKGVSWFKKTRKWRARVAGKTVGYFNTPEEAAHGYDQAARGYFGAFAVLNYPEKTT